MQEKKKIGKILIFFVEVLHQENIIFVILILCEKKNGFRKVFFNVRNFFKIHLVLFSTKLTIR